MPEENPRRRRSYVSSIIAVIVIIALGAGCYYAWKIFSDGIEPVPEVTPTQETQAPPDPTTSYASSTMRISLRYPNGFTLNENYAYTRVSPTKPIGGVQFTVPATFAAGTNLAPDSYISVEQLPRAAVCSGDIYLAANVRSTSVTEGNKQYLLAQSSESAGGNRYEEAVYALASSTPCTAVRYFIHTTSATSTATNTPPLSEFNRDALIVEFDKIRQSLVMQ